MMDDERDRLGDRDTTSDYEPKKGSSRQPTDWRAHRASLPPMNEDANLGAALRGVYQRTVEEDIPQELLDLLKKLG
ncbi:MAG TPA: NepR family anti-sigma factor [Sphingobium sp.]|nr:NepR family anti-sigma factor [Sphingobium sp.]